MLTESRIRQRYVDCLDRATMWLNGHGYAVYPKDIQILTERTAQKTVVVRTAQPFHFRDWPYRFGSSDRLDVLVKFIETISQEDGACVRATTNVTYFRVEKDQALAVESLHYDCNVPPGTQHPICHAQNSRQTVYPLPESFSRQIQAGALQERCQNVRVPTAFINMPGVFTILAADHLSPNHWREFMQHCLVWFKGIPGLRAHALVADAIPKERLAAWAWYVP